MKLNRIFVKNMVTIDLLKMLAKDNMIPIFMQYENILKAKRWADDIERNGNLFNYFERMCKEAV